MSPLGPSVPIVLKQKIFAVMKDDEGPTEQTRRIMLKPKDVPAFTKKELEEFSSNNSMNLFRIFGLPNSFLSNLLNGKPRI